MSPGFFVAHTSQGICSQCIVAGLLFGGIKCNYMCVIASLGVKEEIKNILDSGGFLRDVQQHLQAKFPQIRGISRRSVRRYCQTNGLRGFSAKKLSKTEQENAVKRASKEVHFIILKGEKVDKHPASNNRPPQSSQPAFHHKRSIDYYFFTGL